MPNSTLSKLENFEYYNFQPSFNFEGNAYEDLELKKYMKNFGDN